MWVLPKILGIGEYYWIYSHRKSDWKLTIYAAKNNHFITTPLPMEKQKKNSFLIFSTFRAKESQELTRFNICKFGEEGEQWWNESLSRITERSGKGHFCDPLTSEKEIPKKTICVSKKRPTSISNSLEPCGNYNEVAFTGISWELNLPRNVVNIRVLDGNSFVAGVSNRKIISSMQVIK